MQMSEYLGFLRGSVYGSLNGLESTQASKDKCLTNGITALTAQLIPGRRFRDHQTMLRGNLRHGVPEAVGRNKDQRHSSGRYQLLTQANEAEAQLCCAYLDDYATYQLVGSVVDYQGFHE